MTTVNKLVSSGRIQLKANEVLLGKTERLVIDDMEMDPSMTKLRVGLLLRVKSGSPAPSDIGVSIVDNNTLIERESSGNASTFSEYAPIISGLDQGQKSSGNASNEIVTPLVNGVPSFSVVVNSNQPMLTDKITITYRITALEAS